MVHWGVHGGCVKGAVCVIGPHFGAAAGKYTLLIDQPTNQLTGPHMCSFVLFALLCVPRLLY